MSRKRVVGTQLELKESQPVFQKQSRYPAHRAGVLSAATLRSECVRLRAFSRACGAGGEMLFKFFESCLARVWWPHLVRDVLKGCGRMALSQNETSLSSSHCQWLGVCRPMRECSLSSSLFSIPSPVLPVGRASGWRGGFVWWLAVLDACSKSCTGGRHQPRAPDQLPGALPAVVRTVPSPLARPLPCPALATCLAGLRSPAAGWASGRDSVLDGCPRAVPPVCLPGGVCMAPAAHRACMVSA